MILQALKEYYDRKPELPKYGFEEKEIQYVLVLKSDGTPNSLYSTYEGTGKKRRAKRFRIPQGVKRASNITANLLWDNPEYVTGVVLKGKPQRVAEQHAAFISKVDSLGNLEDEGLKAVKVFLARKNKIQLLEAFGETWQQLCKEGLNMTFQLAGDLHVITERPAIISAIISSQAKSKDMSMCLATGEFGELERLHAAIKGVWGAQSSGANIVSFNLDAFRSFGKVQGDNAPVSKPAAFAYTTALNNLLGKDSKQRMQVGDASTVFWAAKANNFESQMPSFFGEPPKDDPDRNTRAVASLFKSVQSGAYVTDEDKTRFYVLGLAPNASRISIRFWIVSSVAEMAGCIRKHFEDTRINHSSKDRDSLSLFRLLVSTAVQGKKENVPPNLAGDTMRAILEGLPYPQTLLQAAIRRIKAEHEVTYPRAALIKACLNRSIRFNNPNKVEVLNMSLDISNMNVGYRLGRLFTVLEKIQQEANPGINATIRDKFYGAASGTPATVFGSLMRLKNYHLAKLENQGRRVNLEKLLGEILDGIQDFPTHLSLPDQGRFSIGYYHQMQDFYTKKNG